MLSHVSGNMIQPNRKNRIMVLINPVIKKHLDKNRVHSREPYYDVLTRLLGLGVSPETGAGNGQPAPANSTGASA